MLCFHDARDAEGWACLIILKDRWFATLTQTSLFEATIKATGNLILKGPIQFDLV